MVGKLRRFGAIDINQLRIEVPRFQGMRILKITRHTSYKSFRRETAEILDCSVTELNIGYKAGKLKDLKGKITPRVIENEEDYKEMIEEGFRAMEEELGRYRREKTRLAKAAKKGKGKTGAPRKKQVPEIQPYIVNVVVMEEDTPKKTKAKGTQGKKVSCVL